MDRMINVTEIWRLRGSIPNHRFSFFIRNHGEHFKHLCVSTEGRNGKTLAPEHVAEEYEKWIESKKNYRSHANKEHGALCAIEQVMGITLARQHRVGRYRIDGYDKDSNTAYEIDEHHHKLSTKRDVEREREITEMIGCSFVRIKV